LRRFAKEQSNGRASFSQAQLKQCLEKVAALIRQVKGTWTGRFSGRVLRAGFREECLLWATNSPQIGPIPTPWASLIADTKGPILASY
jgi:hypothetical protein